MGVAPAVPAPIVTTTSTSSGTCGFARVRDGVFTLISVFVTETMEPAEPPKVTRVVVALFPNRPPSIVIVSPPAQVPVVGEIVEMKGPVSGTGRNWMLIVATAQSKIAFTWAMPALKEAGL